MDIWKEKFAWRSKPREKPHFSPNKMFIKLSRYLKGLDCVKKNICDELKGSLIYNKLKSKKIQSFLVSNIHTHNTHTIFKIKKSSASFKELPIKIFVWTSGKPCHGFHMRKRKERNVLG